MSDLYVPQPGERVRVVDVCPADPFPNPDHAEGAVVTAGPRTSVAVGAGRGWLYLDADDDGDGTWCHVVPYAEVAPAGTPGPYSGTGTPGVERVRELHATDGKAHPILEGDPIEWGAVSVHVTAPRTSAVRKGQPIATGVLAYFPRSMAAIAAHSRRGNDKHNPGEPLHWAREKSTDEADSAVRHITDALAEGPLALDADGGPHLVGAAWRVLAWLERVLEGDERWRGVAAKKEESK